MRRWVTVVVGGTAIGAAVVALLPWWLGAALRPVARAWGVRFGTYERVGYARFRLTDIRVDRTRVQVTAARLEADTPVVWLARLAAGSAPAVEVEGWQVRVLKTDAEPRRPAGAVIDGGT